MAGFKEHRRRFVVQVAMKELQIDWLKRCKSLARISRPWRFRSRFATAFAPQGLGPPKSLNSAKTLKPYNIAKGMAMSGADATDSTVVGLRLIITATADIVTAHGSR